MKKSFSTLFISYAIILFGIVFIAIYMSFADQVALTKYTKEDGFLEWLTFLSFISLSMMLVFYWIFAIRRQGFKLLSGATAVILGLALVFFLGAMEEVSWMQRIIGFESTNFFKSNNLQSETNFHNLEVAGVKINKLIFGKIMFIVLLMHNLIIPLALRNSQRLKRLEEKWRFFFPPLPLVAIYLVAVLLAHIVSHDRAKEVLEVCGALHYSFSIFAVYFIGFDEFPCVSQYEDSKNYMSLGFVFYTIFLMFVAFILSALSLGTY